MRTKVDKKLARLDIFWRGSWKGRDFWKGGWSGGIGVWSECGGRGEE